MTAPLPRILHVNWRDLRNSLAGGAEVHAHEVYTRLVARGWPVTFASHHERGLPREEVQDGIRIVRAGGAFTFNYTAMLRLRRWVRDEGAGLVVDDSNKIAFYAPLYSPVPVVAHIHHLFGSAVWRETSPPFAAYVRLAESLVPPVYRRTPTMTGSASARRELLALGLRDVTDVGEGVDLTGFSAPAPGERDRDLLLYLGRVKKYKGLDMLLHALARLAPARPRLRLSIAGSGDDVPRLQGLAQELGIAERVVFHGRVSEQEKIDLYRRSAVCLNASVKEGWGLTSIEANGCGTPVVATDVPGLCDSVRDGVTGYLVPFGDAAAMADRVARILDDEALAARMEKESLAWAAWHNWDRVADRTEDVLLRRLGLPARHAEPRAEAA